MDQPMSYTNVASKTYVKVVFGQVVVHVVNTKLCATNLPGYRMSKLLMLHKTRDLPFGRGLARAAGWASAVV